MPTSPIATLHLPGRFSLSIHTIHTQGVLRCAAGAFITAGAAVI
jgi:hypothetical protein